MPSRQINDFYLHKAYREQLSRWPDLLQDVLGAAAGRDHLVTSVVRVLT